MSNPWYNVDVAHECGHGLPALGYCECYAGLKDRLRAGANLTDEEAAFVGFVSTSRATGDGWHDVWAGMSQFELHADLSAEDAAVLAALMGATSADAVRFLA